jgi:CheY-like chemotaxis protein
LTATRPPLIIPVIEHSLTETPRRPIALVVDDEPEWREITRVMLQRIGAEVLLADTIERACEIAAEHPPGSPAALTLAVIDMHMPRGTQDVPLDEQAGISVLRAVHVLHTYRLVQCPVIVFTAWPSYENCAKAVKAGAWAYICKKKDDDGTHGGSRGFDELKECCERILVRHEPLETPVTPGDEWLDRNYRWLCGQFGGQWVAAVPRDRLSACGADLPHRDEVAVIVGSSFEAVREGVLKLLAILDDAPTIFFVPGGH